MNYTIDTIINQRVKGLTVSMLKQAYDASVRVSSPLTNEIQHFVSAGEKYNIDAIYLLAHAIHETGWGTSRIALEKKNLFGYRAYDANPYDNASVFASYAACIDFMGSYISTHYLSSGGKWYGGAPTLRGMNKRYATDKQWGDKIAAIANMLASKITLSPTPSDPKYSVAKVTADKGVNVRTSPTTTQVNIAAKLPMSQTFEVVKVVEGESIEGNAVWYQTPQAYYVWSGGVQIIEDNSNQEVPGSQTQVAYLEGVISKLQEDLNKKNNEYASLNKRYNDLIDDTSSTGADALRAANEDLSGQLQECKTDLSKSREQIFAGWEFMEVSKNTSSFALLVQLLGTIQAIAKGSSEDRYVIGWVKGLTLNKPQ